jgi:hypothetical protein
MPAGPVPLQHGTRFSTLCSMTRTLALLWTLSAEGRRTTPYRLFLFAFTKSGLTPPPAYICPFVPFPFLLSVTVYPPAFFPPISILLVQIVPGDAWDFLASPLLPPSRTSPMLTREG